MGRNRGGGGEGGKSICVRVSALEFIFGQGRGHVLSFSHSMEHERIHIETSSNPDPVPRDPPAAREAHAPLVLVPGSGLRARASGTTLGLRVTRTLSIREIIRVLYPLKPRLMTSAFRE